MPIIIDVRETRPEILELVARADATPGSDEAYFLGQLRSALSGLGDWSRGRARRSQLAALEK